MSQENRIINVFFFFNKKISHHQNNRMTKPNPDDEPAGPVHKLSDVSYDQRVIRSSPEAVVRVADLSWWSTPPPTHPSDFHSRERPRSVYDAPSTSPWLPVAQHYTRWYDVQVSGADPSPTTRRLIYMRECVIQGACFRVEVFLTTFRHDSRDTSANI